MLIKHIYSTNGKVGINSPIKTTAAHREESSYAMAELMATTTDRSKVVTKFYEDDFTCREVGKSLLEHAQYGMRDSIGSEAIRATKLHYKYSELGIPAAWNIYSYIKTHKKEDGDDTEILQEINDGLNLILWSRRSRAAPTFKIIKSSKARYSILFSNDSTSPMMLSVITKIFRDLTFLIDIIRDVQLQYTKYASKFPADAVRFNSASYDTDMYLKLSSRWHQSAGFFVNEAFKNYPEMDKNVIRFLLYISRGVHVVSEDNNGPETAMNQVSAGELTTVMLKHRESLGNMEVLSPFFNGGKLPDRYRYDSLEVCALAIVHMENINAMDVYKGMTQDIFWLEAEK